MLSAGLDASGVGQIVSPFVELTNAGISLARGDTAGAALSAAGAIPIIGTPATMAKAGQRVYRVWGEGAAIIGRYWTTVDPRRLSDVRGALGLFPQNGAQNVTIGRLLYDMPVGVAVPGPVTRPGQQMMTEIVFPSTPVPGVDIVVGGTVPLRKR